MGKTGPGLTYLLHSTIAALPTCLSVQLVLLFHMLLHTGQPVYHTHAPTSLLFSHPYPEHKHALKILKPSVTKAK